MLADDEDGPHLLDAVPVLREAERAEAEALARAERYSETRGEEACCHGMSLNALTRGHWIHHSSDEAAISYAARVARAEAR